MRKLKVKNILSRSAILAVVLCAIVATPLLSSAHAPMASINVTNNSGKDIVHIYLSPPENDSWGADQLNDTTLGAGQSVTLDNISCTGSETKVILENSDGCFAYATLSCTGNASWTVTSNDRWDCGS